MTILFVDHTGNRRRGDRADAERSTQERPATVRL
jgi:hypothetical protein